MNKYIMFLILFFLGTNLYSKPEIDISQVSLSEKEITFLKKIENVKPEERKMKLLSYVKDGQEKSRTKVDAFINMVVAPVTVSPLAMAH